MALDTGGSLARGPVFFLTPASAIVLAPGLGEPSGQGLCSAPCLVAEGCCGPYPGSSTRGGDSAGLLGEGSYREFLVLIRDVRSRRDFSCMAKRGVDMAPKTAVVEGLCMYNKGPPLASSAPRWTEALSRCQRGEMLCSVSQVEWGANQRDPGWPFPDAMTLSLLDLEWGLGRDPKLSLLWFDWENTNLTEFNLNQWVYVFCCQAELEISWVSEKKVHSLYWTHCIEFLASINS